MNQTGCEALIEMLPAPCSCSRVTVTSADLVVQSVGFEDRALAFAERMAVHGQPCALVIDYEPLDPDLEIQPVREALADRGVRVLNGYNTVYNRFAPEDFDQRFELAVLNSRAEKVVVDISTMSKLLILLILHVLTRLGKRVEIFYAEAKSYLPTLEQFETARKENALHRPSIQVYTGVQGVVRVDTLASVAMQGQQTVAFVFMSFNNSLTQVLLNTVYPGRLFLINGRPPVHRWREAATAWIHEQVRKEWEDDNPVGVDGDTGETLPKRAVSTLDYRETVELLTKLYWELSANHRIILAPAGSKMQAIGCSLLKSMYPDIHVEYPSPSGFSKAYSCGVGATWCVDLGNIQQLVGSLSVSAKRDRLFVRALD
jgi:hypothetical protein